MIQGVQNGPFVEAIDSVLMITHSSPGTVSCRGSVMTTLSALRRYLENSALSVGYGIAGISLGWFAA